MDIRHAHVGVTMLCLTAVLAGVAEVQARMDTVARINFFLPNNPAGSNERFNTFGVPVINNAGQVAFMSKSSWADYSIFYIRRIVVPGDRSRRTARAGGGPSIQVLR